MNAAGERESWHKQDGYVPRGAGRGGTECRYSTPRRRTSRTRRTLVLKDDSGTAAKMYGKSIQAYGIRIHHEFGSRTLVVPASWWGASATLRSVGYPPPRSGDPAPPAAFPPLARTQFPVI